MSTLKVGTIQDHANSNTAISIDSGGRVTLIKNQCFNWFTGTEFAGGVLQNEILLEIQQISNAEK